MTEDIVEFTSEERARVVAFLKELKALTERTGLTIRACSCCQGINLRDGDVTLANSLSDYNEDGTGRWSAFMGEHSYGKEYEVSTDD